MQESIHDWLGHTWIALRAEGLPGLDPPAQTADIFPRLDAQPSRRGLSLADTMRTRRA